MDRREGRTKKTPKEDKTALHVTKKNAYSFLSVYRGRRKEGVWQLGKEKSFRARIKKEKKKNSTERGMRGGPYLRGKKARGDAAVPDAVERGRETRYMGRPILNLAIESDWEREPEKNKKDSLSSF